MADGKISRLLVVILLLCGMVAFLSYCFIQVPTIKLDHGRFALNMVSESGNNSHLKPYQNILALQPLAYSKEAATGVTMIAPKDARKKTSAKPLPIKRNTNEKCKQRLPSVIMVGSQKSGTSAFKQFANYHPQIAALGYPDEARYFTTHYNKHSLNWYRRMIPCSYSNQLTMEKSPGYFYGNITAMRIKQMNESTKILMIFKDPVEVAISIFAMWKAHNHTEVNGKDFEDVVTELDSNNKLVVNVSSLIVWYSTYILHAKTWEDIFGKTQVYAFDGTAFEKNPFGELKQLQSFLGLKQFYKKEHFVFSQIKKKYCFAVKPKSIKCLKRSKGRAHPKVSKKVISLLRNYFKPFNAQLSDLMNRTFTWQ